MLRGVLTATLAAGLFAAGVHAEESPSAGAVGGDRGEAYYHLMRATILARQGSVSDAARSLRQAVRLEPGSAELKTQAADLLLSIGQQGEAERWVREALTLAPADPDALRLLGEILLARSMASGGDPRVLREAGEIYDRIVARPEATDEDFRILATIRLQLGEGDGGVSAARALVLRAPADLEATRVLVRSLEQTGRGREAVVALLDWLEASGSTGAEPADVVRVTGLTAQLVARESAWDLVAERGERLVRGHPDTAVLHSLYGEALLRTGREAEAAGQLETAVALMPESGADLEFYLATAYASMGRLYDAAEIAERMAQERPDTVAVLNLLGEVRAQRGEVDRAVAAFGAGLALLGSDVERRDARDALRRRIAALELARDRPQAAAAALSRLEFDGRPEDLELQAVIAIAQGDGNRARAAIARMKAAGPEGTALAAMLEGHLLASEGSAAKAQARFREAAGRLGNGILGRGAEALRESGKSVAGEELLREWVAKEPGSSRAHFRLGAYLEREKRHAEADAELQRAIELTPDDAEALNYLGYSLADRAVELERALELVQRAVRLDPWNAAYLDSLGWTLFHLGRFEEARKPLEQAAREFPSDPVVLEHLGDLYNRLGERDRAREYWQRALDSGSEHGELLRRKLAGSAGS